MQSPCANVLDTIEYNGINCAPVRIAAQSQLLVGSENEPGKAYLSSLTTPRPLSRTIVPVATARLRVLMMLGPTTATWCEAPVRAMIRRRYNTSLENKRSRKSGALFQESVQRFQLKASATRGREDAVVVTV